jgi:hypothetical protein
MARLRCSQTYAGDKGWNPRDLLSAGGEGEIRTPDTVPRMSAFEADRFNHSRTSPRHDTREWPSGLGIKL